jgi:hypothetical protein
VLLRLDLPPQLDRGRASVPPILLTVPHTGAPLLLQNMPRTRPTPTDARTRAFFVSFICVRVCVWVWVSRVGRCGIGRLLKRALGLFFF